MSAKLKTNVAVNLKPIQKIERSRNLIRTKVCRSLPVIKEENENEDLDLNFPYSGNKPRLNRFQAEKIASQILDAYSDEELC